MKYFRIYKKKVAAVIAFNLLVEIIAPSKLWALTGGPSQPEVQSFQPVSISDMVNPFTGDFSYNIPLLDVDGYPINLSYNSGISNDQEASWVGLGWNINPGNVSRSMRGIPDEFNGGDDAVKKEYSMRPNYTIGATVSAGLPTDELFGVKLKNMELDISYSLGLNFNNYNGYGVEQSISPSVDVSTGSKGTLNFDMGLKTSSSGGLTISPEIGFARKSKIGDDREVKRKMSIGTSFNNRSGLSDLTISTSASWQGDKFNPGPGLSVLSGMNSYTPTINMPMRNYSANFKYKFGGKVMGYFPNGSISGYYSWQGLNLVDGQMTVPAYGYLNSQNVSKDGDGYITGMMDINRDWDVAYNKNTPNLPITNYTYDILSASGQGMSGSFRPFRTDYGFVSDNFAQNVSSSGSLSMEAGAGNVVHGGMDISTTSNNTTTRNWKSNNSAAALLQFRSSGDDIAYEPYAYKEMGELSVDDEPSMFENIGSGQAVRIGLESAGGMEIKTRTQFENTSGGIIDIPTKNYRSKRLKRNQVLSILKFSELPYKGLNSNDDPLYTAPSHHIGEVSVVRNDGARYIYGLPAYNTYQEEVSFAVGMHMDKSNHDYETPGVHQLAYKESSGLFNYNKGDNTTSNKRGRDHMYSCTKMPAYAHSFILTAVLSPDYVDIDVTRGPSQGDLGNYTVFKYKKLTEKYKWRTPYDVYGYSANFNEGLKSDLYDDRANYIYGEKEVWYLEKIVTKNTVAIFTLDNRKDGFECNGRDGGIGKLSTKLLRKISLYNLKDYETNGASAIPIKEVHFEYDYSLCPNVPNNSGVAEMDGSTNLNANKGKLTLKKVYFTYGTSYKSKFSPYSFDYTNLYDNTFNPGYGLKNYDRWGNYKPNQGNLMDLNGVMTNSEYPYTEQNSSLENKYATAWTLSKIFLPSGGTIKIEAESDDYAYVQDQIAMQMFKVNSIGDDPSASGFLTSGGNKLMKGAPISGVNEFMSIALSTPIPASESDKSKYFYDHYLKGIDNMYFKFLVNIKNAGDPKYEYVSGYVDMQSMVKDDDYGTKSSTGGGDHDYAWIRIKKVAQGDHLSVPLVHPISKAAWHFGRQNMSKALYNESTPDEYSLGSFIQQMNNAGFAKNIIQTLMGANGVLKEQDFGKEVVLNHSFIRLLSPNRKKLGGGLRVKKIEISDEWANMVSGNTSTSYGQEYDYTTLDAQSGQTISSGVAAFEPGIGGEENALKQPIWYGDKDENLLMPDEKGYLEGPVGESFFPSASVGYSKVTVKNFGTSTVKRHGTGYVVNEYYTAKDFPTIVANTTIDAKPKKTKPWFRLLKVSNRDYMTVSQGYAIELNDMHGKQKAMWVYAEDAGKPISGVEYKYKSKTYKSGSHQLTNTAKVVSPDGSVNDREIGVEFDFVTDFREQKTTTVTGGLNTNLTNFLAAFVPVVTPIILPSFSKEETRFRSAVATKIISRYGILEETIAHDLGSTVSTQNLAYDSETGLVLLTKTKNNFEDDIYSFNYPAHWYYGGMGQAYKNLGIFLSGVTISGTGEFTVDNAENFFVPGDELVYDNYEIAWVKTVTGNTVKLMNEMGRDFNPVNSGKDLRLVRSGRRNLIGVSMGSITSLENPLPNLKTNMFAAVLNTNAQVFKDEWGTFCDCFLAPDSKVKNSENQYAIGNKGIWRAYKSFAYLTDRVHTWKNNNTNIRQDGIYAAFNPYWKYTAGSWGPDPTNWTWTSEITQMSPYGAELENVDALNRYSAATYGYNNTVPTAVVANSKYREVGFDGMEDYEYQTCVGAHFGFRSEGTSVTSLSSHTGKRSLRVTSSAGISVSKTLSICTE